MSKALEAVRPTSLIEFPRHPPQAEAGLRRWTGRGQNFSVTYMEAVEAGASGAFTSRDEIMLLNLDKACTVAGAGETVQAPPRSVSVLPPGQWTVSPMASGRCVVIQSLREGDGAPQALNQDAYRDRDVRIAPVGAPYERLRDPGKAQVLRIDDVAAPSDKARLKMLQTSTLSINWVDYEGPRDRTQLSPHSHSSFEQGSLGLDGDFVHHLRTPWGENSEVWKEDHHAALASPSLMIVPVGLIHTSEGVGPGRHLLIDVFSPPRADFIAKGWVANAGDYAARKETA